MIKWLWRVIVGCGCWGNKCQWEEVGKFKLRNHYDEEMGVEYVLRCKICGNMKSFTA